MVRCADALSLGDCKQINAATATLIGPFGHREKKIKITTCAECLGIHRRKDGGLGWLVQSTAEKKAEILSTVVDS